MKKANPVFRENLKRGINYQNENQILNEIEINVNPRLDRRQLITQSSRQGSNVGKFFFEI